MIIPAGYAQANFRFSNDNNEHRPEVTMGLNIDLYGGSAQDLAEDLVDTWLASNWNGVYTAAFTMDEVAVKFGPNSTGPSGLASATDVGEATGQAVPSNTAAIIRKNTSDGGRAGRGRFYLPGVPEPDVDSGGNLAGIYLGNLQDISDDFLAALATLLTPMVVLHSAGSPITTPSLVTSLTALQRCGTQRDRMR